MNSMNIMNMNTDELFCDFYIFDDFTERNGNNPFFKKCLRFKILLIIKTIGNYTGKQFRIS